jgi:hypothetical protein
MFLNQNCVKNHLIQSPALLLAIAQTHSDTRNTKCDSHVPAFMARAFVVGAVAQSKRQRAEFIISRQRF